MSTPLERAVETIASMYHQGQQDASLITQLRSNVANYTADLESQAKRIRELVTQRKEAVAEILSQKERSDELNNDLTDARNQAAEMLADTARELHQAQAMCREQAERITEGKKVNDRLIRSGQDARDQLREVRALRDSDMADAQAMLAAKDQHVAALEARIRTLVNGEEGVDLQPGQRCLVLVEGTVSHASEARPGLWWIDTKFEALTKNYTSAKDDEYVDRFRVNPNDVRVVPSA